MHYCPDNGDSPDGIMGIGAEDDQDYIGRESASPRQSSPEREFDDALFRALVAMAMKSPRFQADVHAAMRHANLRARPASLAAALQRLEDAGRVSQLIPLSDGGLLISVAV